MKEITMIATCEITSICTFSDEDVAVITTHKDEFEKALRERIKSDLHADDVNILKNQIFIRDVPN